MSDLHRSDLLAVLRRPQTIRARCAAITRAVEDDRSGWFRIDRTRLDETAARVEAVIRRRFPDLRIPLHSRWRHFEAGGVDRKAELDALLAALPPLERARAMVDLTVVSVLLDAGAGPTWSYEERSGLTAAALPAEHLARDDLMAMLDAAAGATAPPPPAPAEATPGPASAPDPAPAPAPAAPAPAGDAPSRYTRSEGLGVACFRAFVGGAFSSLPGEPCRVDAAALRQIDATALRAVFQAGPNNPLVGLEGRAGLLQRLGAALNAQARIDDTPARPALLFDRTTDRGRATLVDASVLLGEVLRSLSPVWTSGSTVMGVPAGDVWPHRWAGADTSLHGPGDAAATEGAPDDTSRGWVPFHKLSQWLTYSLVEPFEWAGVRMTGLDALTGLPEYRNGGLLIDAGVIVPRSAGVFDRSWKPADEFVIEWRALTVTLLDELAARVRARLGRDAGALPLAALLEGGTWTAGRELAAERRAGGAPPFRIESDGTVF